VTKDYVRLVDKKKHSKFPIICFKIKNSPLVEVECSVGGFLILKQIIHLYQAFNSF
jgi:hypothetical protein